MDKPLGAAFLDEKDRVEIDKQRIVALMLSSRSEKEWNDNCDAVKAEFGGYPRWWYETIIMSGVLPRTAARWGDNGKIKIRHFGPTKKDEIL